MSVFALLAEVEPLGVRLFVREGRVGYRAPKGTMTPELLASLSAHKEALKDALMELEERAAIMQFDAWMTRTEAEAGALAYLILTEEKFLGSMLQTSQVSK
jgi:hypothetical protein